MKNKIILTTIVSFVLILQSCRDDRFGCIRGEGKTTTETRTVSDFEEIEIQSGATLYITEDSIYSFTATAQENLLENLIVSIRNGKILVKDRRCVRGKNDMIINIHAPKINNITVNGSATVTQYKKNTTVEPNIRYEMNGSGNLRIVGTVYGTDIFSKITGSGDIEYEANCVQSNMTISGSGHIYVQGVANVSDFKIAGSGEVDAFELQADDVWADITGSGNIKTTANKTLDVNISGSGRVEYKGWPRISSRISGSGSISSRN